MTTRLVSVDAPLDQIISQEDILKDRARTQYLNEVGRIKDEHYGSMSSAEIAMENQAPTLDILQQIDQEQPGSWAASQDAPVNTSETFWQNYSDVHDYAHLDSLEQKIADRVNIFKDEFGEDSPVLSVEEIHQRSREAGVELKQSKPMTEVQFNYYLNKEMRRQDLAQRLADWQERPNDYNAFQKAQLAWAGISGSVGLAETVAGAALGWAMAPASGALATTLASAGEAFGLARDVSQGVRLAKLSLQVQKGNAALNKGIQIRNKVAKLDALGKVAYDATRFGARAGATQAVGGASTLSTAAAFAVDGALTDAPFAIARQGLNFAETGDASWKDLFVEMGVSGLGGFAMPPAGKVIGGGAYLLGKGKNAIVHQAQELLNAKYTDGWATAKLAGREGAANDIAKQAGQANKMIQDIHSAILGLDEQKAIEQVAIDFDNLDALNILAEEDDMFAAAATEFGQTGDVSAITNKPWKGIWLSKVPHVSNVVKSLGSTFDECMESNADEFFAALAERGTKSEVATPSKSWLYRVDMNMPRSAKGQIERLYVKTTNPEDAKNLMKAMYISKFHPDQGVRDNAMLFIAKEKDHLQRCYDKLEAARNMYSTIADLNNVEKNPAAKKIAEERARILAKYGYSDAMTFESKEAREVAKSEAFERMKIAGERYPESVVPRDLQLKSFAFNITDNNGNVLATKAGNLYDVLQDFFAETLPASVRERYHNIQVADILKQKISPEDAEWMKEINIELDKRIKDIIKPVEKRYAESDIPVNALGTPDEKILWNFKKVNGFKSHTAYIEARNSDIKEGIGTLDDFFNLDEAYQKNVLDEKALQEAMDKGAPMETFAHVIQEDFKDAPGTVKSLLTDETKKQELLAMAKDDFKYIEEHANMDALTETLDAMTSRVASGMEDAAAMGFYDSYHHIMGCAKLLESNWGEVLKTVMDNIGKVKEFQGLNSGELADALNQGRDEVKKIIKDSINEVAGARIMGSVSEAKISKDLANATDAVIDKYLDEVKTVESPARIQNEIDFDAPLPKEEAESVEAEVVEKTATEEINDDKIREDILRPLMKQVGLTVMDNYIPAIQDMGRLYTQFSDVVRNPGVMASNVMNIVSSDAASPVRGAGMSIEVLSDPTSHIRDFEKALAEDTSENSGSDGVTRSLAEWKQDEHNQPEIREAIAIEQLCADIEDENARQTLRKRVGNNAQKVAKLKIAKDKQLQEKLYLQGSRKQQVGSIFDNQKLARYREIDIGDHTNNAHAKGMRDITISSTKATPEMKKLLQSWEPRGEGGTTVNDWHDANAGYHFLEVSDCDKQFAKGEKYKLSLNSLRNSLTSAKDFDALFNLYTPEEIESSLRALTVGMHGGVDARGKLTRGLIKGFSMDYQPLSSDSARFSSRYLEDTVPKIHYKDNNALLDDLKYFGYDDIDTHIRTDWERACKAHSILSKAGPEPYDHFKTLLQMTRVYAYDVLGKKADIAGGAKAQQVAKAIADLKSKTFERNFDYCIHTVCGTGNIPLRPQYRWLHLARRVISSGLLGAAGFKSNADVINQHHQLVQMGLATGGDYSAQPNFLRTAGIFFGMKPMTGWLGNNAGLEFRSRVLFQQMSKMGELTQEKYMGVNDIMAKGLQNKSGVKLAKDAPLISKAEQWADKWVDFVTNKAFRIGPMTDCHKASAVTNIMTNLAQVAPDFFKNDTEQSRRVLTSLGRYNINQYEWEHVYAGNCMMTVNDYLKSNGLEQGMGWIGELKMFFADNTQKLPDEKIKAFLVNQGKPHSDLHIKQYRYELEDKAMAFLNGTANEMTTLPTARVSARMSLGQLPNTGTGELMNALTQFQSYNFASGAYHRDRALSKWLTPDDPFWNGYVENALSNPVGSFKATAPYMATMALTSDLLELAIGFAGGKVPKPVKDDGEFNWEDYVGHMVIEQGLNAWGGATSVAANSVVQAMGIGKGGGQKGSLSFQVAPAASVLVSHGSRIVQAATREDVDDRASAILGAVGEDVARLSGVASFLPTKPFYVMTIQDTLNEMQYGSAGNWERKRKQAKTNYGGLPEILNNALGR